MARLFKRGNVWYAWVGQPGGGTVKQSTNCSDKKAAEKRADELERESIDPGHAAANKAATRAACDEFIASRLRRGRAQGTLHHYRVKLGHVTRLMPVRLADIDASACERFIEQRLAEGAAQTTVKKEIRALGAMLRHASRRGDYVRIVDAVIPELEETYRPRERFLLPLELVALLSALPPERAARVVFIVATGARWGESDRALRSDYDRTTGMVTIRGTKTKRSAAMIPVPPTMRVAIDWALAQAPEAGHALFRPWGNVRRDLLAACKSVGIDPVTPNDLRRTFATWLAMSGVSSDLVGKMLRHTTSRMADRIYGRIQPTDLSRLITERSPALLMEKESKTPGLLMGGDLAVSGASEVAPETATLQETAGFSVPAPGIEPGTRGFSIPAESRHSSGKQAHFAREWAANGLTFRERAHRWLTKDAA